MKSKKSLSALLTPDYMFDSFSDVTPEFLEALGIKALLIDIDNTLAPYEQAEPDEKILAWLSSLKENGIKFAFISNNSSPDRIDLFNKNIGALAYARSAKPLAKNTKRALAELGASKETSAFLFLLLGELAAGIVNGFRGASVFFGCLRTFQEEK